VDPKKQWVEIYLLANEKYKLHQRAERVGEIRSVILERLELDLIVTFAE